MSKQTPIVSVLMSVYNGSIYLKESIESILNQTFSDFEFIIIDDCSTDNSYEIISEYANKDERIVLVKNQENLGLTKSLNKGLKIAKGKYIARQDADDISLAERFEKEVTLLDNNSEVALVSCDIELINSQSNVIGKEERACDTNLVNWYLLFYNRLAGHSQVMFRRKLVIDLGGYCENYRYTQDYELWCRVVKVGKISILPEILLQQRRHNQSISAAKSSGQETYALVQVKRNVSQLISKEISLEEARYLQGFWLGHWWSNCFPDIKKIGNVNSMLRDVYQGFIKQKSRLELQQNDSLAIRTIIEFQYVQWIKSLSLKRKLFSKVIVSLYAMTWNPSKVIICWIMDILNLSSRFLSLLFIRIKIMKAL